MKVELGMLIGVILSSVIFVVFLLEYCRSRTATRLKKEIHLEKRKCEVCSSVYFVSIFFEFWNCPLCGSINREQDVAKSRAK